MRLFNNGEHSTFIITSPDENITKLIDMPQTQKVIVKDENKTETSKNIINDNIEDKEIKNTNTKKYNKTKTNKLTKENALFLNELKSGSGFKKIKFNK